VIRSKAEWNEGPTEVAAPALDMPKPRNWRALWLIGAVLWGIAAVAFAMRAKPDRSGVGALETRAEMLATTLDAEARATLVRADAIATSPVLRAAIETDASTLADMARDKDVAFTLRAGESLEVYQWRGGQRALLLRLPHTARPLVVPAAGQARLDAAGDRVVATATSPIANGRAKIAGEIVLSAPVDLTTVTNRLAEYAQSAVLVGLGQPVALVPGNAKANLTIPIAAKTPAAGALALQASIVEGGGSFVFAWLSMTIAALLLGMFVVTTVRARREA
jgi:hypothetical protein